MAIKKQCAKKGHKKNRIRTDLHCPHRITITNYGISHYSIGI